ncbi:MAG: DUF1697 domain-containing protein [Chlorobiota bacterium]
MNLKKYIVFLRGINVGGNHKLPMSDLKNELLDMGYTNVQTLLNSGNVILESNEKGKDLIESEISKRLEDEFGFPVPTIVRTEEEIKSLHESDPFANIELTKDIRQYVSFQKVVNKSDLVIPWQSDDSSFQILSDEDGIIVSVLDLSKTGTPNAMKIVEEKYGKNITTRNWKTISRIIKKLA